MIVTVAEVKAVLGIPDKDTSSDDRIMFLIQAATAWVQGETHRQFDGTVDTVEYHEGDARRKLFLKGYFDPANLVASASDSILVFRRPLCEPRVDWEPLLEGEDWERRGQALLYLGPWSRWPREDEFQVQYPNGWVTAPADIKLLVMNLVTGQFLADAATASGTAGLTGEDIGDYSYTQDLGAVAATLSGGVSALGTNDWNTINRYKRQFA